MAKWRVKYTRRLGERIYGDKPKEYFKFFDETNDTLGPTYVAFLLAKEDNNDCWYVIGQIFLLLSGSYVMVDSEGKNMSRGTIGKNIFIIGLRDKQPSIEEFKWWLK